MNVEAKTLRTLGVDRVMLAGGRTDLRRGAYGLAALVQLRYGMDPLQNDVVWLFCGKRRDRIKCLAFTPKGLICSSFILLDVVQWPRSTEDLIELDADAFERFLNGEIVVPKQRSRQIAEEQRQLESTHGNEQPAANIEQSFE